MPSTFGLPFFMNFGRRFIMIIENGQYIVYCHTNKINGKKYVGQTKLLPEIRWGKNGCKYSGSRHFYSAIQKYGWDNFEHEIVASNLTLEEANNFEVLLIQKLGTQNPNKGYNIAFGGNNKEPTEETKKIWKEQRSGGRNCNAKKVICDNMIFDCIGDCASYYDVDRRLMNGWLLCNNPMPQNFIEKQLRFANNSSFAYKERVGMPKGASNNKSKAVVCEGIRFDSVTDCAQHYHINFHTMYNWLKHEKKMPQHFIDLGLSFEEDETKHISQIGGKKSVICDGVIYNTIRGFCDIFNIRENLVSRWLKGQRKMPQEWQDRGLSYYEGGDVYATRS